MTQSPHDPGRTYGQEPTDPYRTAPHGHQGQAPQGYGPGPGQPAAPRGGQGVDGDERTMMMLAHLSAPISFLFSVGYLPFLGPLLIWLFYKDRSPAVRHVAAGAFNFNLSMTIATWITWASVFITLFVGLIWAIPILIVLFIIQVWAHVKGTLMASRGEIYEYPFQIRLLS